MASTLKIDLIDGGNYRRQYSSLRGGIEEATRIGIVSGLSSEATAETALVRARVIIEAMYPVGTSYDPVEAPNCRAYQYQVEGISTHDDTVRVRILYQTPAPGPPIDSGVAWAIEEDGYEDSDEGETFVKWTNPNKNSDKVMELARYTKSEPIVRLVCKAVIPASQILVYENYQGALNDGPFRTLGRAHWKFATFRTQSYPTSPFALATVELLGKRYRDWSRNVYLRDPDGRAIVTQEEIDRVNAEEYPADEPFVDGNGVKRITDRYLVNFDSLFPAL